MSTKQPHSTATNTDTHFFSLTVWTEFVKKKHDSLQIEIQDINFCTVKYHGIFYLKAAGFIGFLYFGVL